MLATLCVASFGVAGAATGAASLRGVPSPSTGLAAENATASAALLRDSFALRQVLSADFPASFGGIVVSRVPAITVYMTTMPSNLAAIVDAHAPRGSVLYARSAHPISELLAVHRRLSASWPWLQAQGIDLVGFAQDVQRSTELIEVIGPTPSQVAVLGKLLGASLITVDSVPVAPIPAGFASRVQGEVHGAFPSYVAPLLAALVGAVVLLVALLLVVARRPRRSPASTASIDDEAREVPELALAA